MVTTEVLQAHGKDGVDLYLFSSYLDSSTNKDVLAFYSSFSTKMFEHVPIEE